MAEVVMPRLSDSMEEGTILQWLKQVGDEVAVGDELVEIETDKANMAYESDLAGTLTEILAEEGATLPIGTPIARIGDSDAGPGALPRVLTRMSRGRCGPSCPRPPRHPRHPRRASGTQPRPSRAGGYPGRVARSGAGSLRRRRASQGLPAGQARS